MIRRSEFGHPMFGVSLLLTLADLKALDVTEHVPHEHFTVNDGSVAGAPPVVYYYHPTSMLTADDVFVVAPTSGAGRYLLAPNVEQDLSLAIGFATADAAVLATTPTNAWTLVGRGYWEVTADFTGGTTPKIGLSSSATGYTTKGDLLGGASGDAAATLVTGKALGTIGAKTAAGILLPPASAIRFDRIADAFTAGAGFAHLTVHLLQHPGA